MSLTRFCRFCSVFFTILSISPFYLFSQISYTISGHIRDAGTGETLIGASIRLKEQPSIGTRTNNYGFFSLTLREGTQILVISHVGYQEREMPMNLTRDTTIEVDLSSGE